MAGHSSSPVDILSSESEEEITDCCSDFSIVESTSKEAPDPVPVVSLLSYLKSPPPSEFGRKRQIVTNPPPVGKRRSRGSSVHEPKKVHAHQRVKGFPKEPFKVNINKKLFCEAELSLKLSNIHNHVRSSKHAEGKRKLQTKEARERSIADALERHNETTHMRGETLPDSQQVYWVKMVTYFLHAGVPLNKLNCFRDLLEENAMRLSDRRFMSDLIPFIHKEEQRRIKEEITGKQVSVIFDGTTRLGEALSVVLRYIGNDWSVNQRLVRLQLLAKSLTGEEIACELSTTYGIDSSRLLASMRDGASTNGIAIRTLKIVYPRCMDVVYFSHTIDRVGSHFKTPVLDEFVSAWISMFSHIPKARLCWKQLTGMSMASYSPTRWWSKWEVMNQIFVQFGDIEGFLTANSDLSPASHEMLTDIFQNTQKSTYLQLELASIVDWGEQFVKATYTLEGDGPLSFKCYEVIDTLFKAISSAHYPNVNAVVRKLACMVPSISQSQMSQYALKCIQPGLDYFKQQMNVKLKDTLMAFKAASLFSPQKVHSMQPAAVDIECLTAFPFFDDDFISELKKEIPSYLSKSADTDEGFCPLKWWKQNAPELPYWAQAA